MNEKKENLILDLSFEFALQIIEFCETLEAEKKFIVGRQLLNSATSIGANIREAQSSESKIDFIHKIKIAAKESEETEYWLLLCKYSKTYPFNEELLVKLDSIKKIIFKIIITSKNSM